MMNDPEEDIISHCRSIRDYLRLAVSACSRASVYLGHGTDNYWDEALHLILGSLSLNPAGSKAMLGARLLPSERALLWQNIQKRVIERMPTPYIVGEAWFLECPFYVDQRVIIPRSPLAESIRGGFAPWLDVEQIHTVLDLCTGSGCMAIATALEHPHLQVDAIDLSSAALEVAQINQKRYGLEDRLHLIQSDLFEAVPAQKRYDLILSNPPYVAEAEYKSLPPEYRHEPVLSLEAGAEGLDIVLRILQKASDFLQPQGILMMEVGSAQAALEQRFPEVPFTWLHFEGGGEGVFLLTAADCREFFAGQRF